MPASSLLDTDFAHLDLSNIRTALIRQEETLIFAFLERAQFRQNKAIYTPGAIEIPTSEVSNFLEFLLLELESSFAKVRRYTSPDEFPFSPLEKLPPPVLKPLDWPHVLKNHRVNINATILKTYLEHILPSLCEEGDDQQYGSATVADIACLQALSKRIHYGLFVAESKFRSDPETFSSLIRSKDKDGIMAKITDKAVEERVMKRVLLKAKTYAQDIGDQGQQIGARCLMDPELMPKWFSEFVMPLTKEVEVQYLLERLDE